MIDFEVERLRQLRVRALQLRSVARALGHNKWTQDDLLLSQGRCAAWRITRIVSGRLRAHPNERYQRDAGVGTLVKNSVIAAMISWAASNRRRAMTRYGRQLKTVLRELDDARALTSAANLSDTLGRSQLEIRALLEAVSRQADDCGDHAATRRGRRTEASANGESPFLTI